MKKLPAIVFIAVVSILILNRCVEPFEVDIPAGANNLLVVDGLITNQAGPYTVKISRSVSLQENEFQTVNNATVSIEEEGGPIEILVQTGEGQYQSHENGIRGAAGKRYRLTIALTDEKRYESSWVTLKPSPEIDQVYFEFEEKDTEDENEPLPGVQIFLDTHDPDNNTRFYRWEWDETWRYTVPLATSREYLGNDLIRRLDTVKGTCWHHASSNTISIGSSLKSTQDVISRQPLLFVSNETDRLRRRYSILVKQYAIDQDEYIFWNALQESNNNPGSFFDKQPQSTTGNLRSLDNSNERVLGYFSAAGVSTKRIFIDRTDIPRDVKIITGLEACNLKLIDKSPTSEQQVFDALESGMVFFDLKEDFFGNVTGYFLTTRPCADCTVFGGSLERPAFWDE
ncbi:DUF4249 domain-containing protein [Fulvivirgaceae bacterium BMA10]|uniref:DUF4249 domain-containing protein n=1 Tax=Splendidivirga corallicola TaxID=3051826 RepID=A0ABT8KI68_9BACT|nr:DUF4249 domain-containing protein [Fulvivirgaceae bacterium BMA10]